MASEPSKKPKAVRQATDRASTSRAALLAIVLLAGAEREKEREHINSHALNLPLLATKKYRGTMKAGDIDAESKAFDTFEDLLRCRHVLAGDYLIGWWAQDLPRHQSDEGAASIDVDLVKLIMATAQL